MFSTLRRGGCVRAAIPAACVVLAAGGFPSSATIVAPMVASPFFFITPARHRRCCPPGPGVGEFEGEFQDLLNSLGVKHEKTPPHASGYKDGGRGGTYFHHDKHHAAYVANANKAVAGKPPVSLLELQKDAIKIGGGTRNAGGGHYNHCLFWKTLCSASSSGSPSPELAKAIDAAFGSMDAMKDQFGTAAAGVFGSGWAWLGCTPDGKLAITSTPNQDNPLMDGASGTAMLPILGLDVWEHAYYLKYQNRRPEYISAFWNVVNWPVVSENYEMYASNGLGVPVNG